MPSSSSASYSGSATGPGARALLAPVQPRHDLPADPDRVVLVDGEVVGQARSAARASRRRRATRRRTPRRSPSSPAAARPGTPSSRSLIITTWSDMPGMYAPPAVELPNTSAMVGIPAADSRVRSRKHRPPGMKISFCVGRSAPPDSTSEITGSRFSQAISLARSVFFSVHGLLVPPLTVGSLATDHALDALDHADARHHAGADREVGALGGQRRQLEKRRVGVEQQFDAFARGQLAALVVPLDVLLAAAAPAPSRARRRSRRAWLAIARRLARRTAGERSGIRGVDRYSRS